MEENPDNHFLVIGYIKTETGIRPGQQLNIWRESLNPDNVCHSNKEVILIDFERIMEIKFITSSIKIESTINSIMSILSPNNIVDQEWFQIEATRLIPNKTEE
ncbi:MAG: hypothetical protein COU83_02865 [Candidatus Portnoybacteria bacterium CG10_big_fil_rev_8_21_14_0_10_40_22]|uniref:Uncharacterized protein n=1 Tax=Candidatus Portnoybacteria bacterium CG10_big_fil_rev_8_21_14_0_10_40_22 TaxID=1974814 RepID=A0A2M8KFD8_9BACT|nr:MAG: hypothetical protein AUJ33_02375 [Parcubacteria group bacterium CG1_02_40_25]PJE58628.1 MAG: hypothetical protein COU83_02865 [Candidatus Portnoybacteria bacterium CG10_big_fil_rev_8_21_14_0_10_40_22]